MNLLLAWGVPEVPFSGSFIERSSTVLHVSKDSRDEAISRSFGGSTAGPVAFPEENIKCVGAEEDKGEL